MDPYIPLLWRAAKMAVKMIRKKKAAPEKVAKDARMAKEKAEEKVGCCNDNKGKEVRRRSVPTGKKRGARSVEEMVPCQNRRYVVWGGLEIGQKIWLTGAHICRHDGTCQHGIIGMRFPDAYSDHTVLPYCPCFSMGREHQAVFVGPPRALS
jgi:hypothetical protein